ncbi:MAG: hypothetical protein AABZ33_04530 [Chloroflexota bacterium]
MLQTQRQATVNLGSARAALVLAAAFGAAAVVGQIAASNPFATPATGSGVAVPVPIVVVPEITTRTSEFSTGVQIAPAPATPWEIEAGARRGGATSQSTTVHDSGRPHRGELIPQ